MNTAHACGVTIDRSVRSVRSVRPDMGPHVHALQAGGFSRSAAAQAGREATGSNSHTANTAPGAGPMRTHSAPHARPCQQLVVPSSAVSTASGSVEVGQGEPTAALRGSRPHRLSRRPRPPSTSHQRGPVWGRLNRSFWALARAGWWRTAQYKGCQRTRCLLPQAKPSHNLAVSCTGVMYSP